MKIASVTTNGNDFHVTLNDGAVHRFPHSVCRPEPDPGDPVIGVEVDPELGGEAFTFRLASGAEGSVHADTILEYVEDPEYLAKLAVYADEVAFR